MKNIEKYKDEIVKEYKDNMYIIDAISDSTSLGNALFSIYNRRNNDKELDIIEWLTSEYKEPILTDEGIEFLKEHIKQSGATAVYIKITKKVANYYEYRLEIHLETGLISIPFVEKSNLYEMFKNVEIGQDYLPEELGL